MSLYPTTSVSAIVQDPAGNLYTYARVAFDLVPASGTQVPANYTTQAILYTDESGQFTTPLASNDYITPAGSTWSCSIISSDGQHSFIVTGLSITGTTQDITTQLKAVAASLSTTSLSQNVQRLNGIRFADQFPGADIGAKINAAVADASTNCTIYVPAGTYSYSTSIVLADGISLEGAGPLATMLTYTGASNAIQANFISRSIISNLGITLSNASAVGIKVGGTHNTVRDVYITGTAGKGIWVTGSGVSSQSFTTFITNVDMQNLNATALMQIDHAVDTYLSNVHLFAPQDNTTSTALLIDTGTSGVNASKIVTGWGLHALWVKNSTGGVGAYNTSPVYLFFDQFVGDAAAGGDGWLFDSSLSTNLVSAHFTNSWASSSGKNSGGTVQTAGANGVHISGGTAINISSSRIMNNAGNGVLIDSANVADVTIDGNHILANNLDNNADEHGIYITAAATHVSIVNNLIGNTGLGNGHQKYGIKVGAVAAGSLDITGNDLSLNMTGGLSNSATGTYNVLANLPITEASTTGITNFSAEGGGTSAAFGQITTANPKQLLIATTPASDSVDLQAVQQGVGYSQTLRLNPNGGAVSIGGGTGITKEVVYSASLTPASVGAATVAEQTFTVSGLTTADKVYINPPSTTAGVGIAGVRVSAADTLAIAFVNPTTGALTPPAGTYQIIAIRS